MHKIPLLLRFLFASLFVLYICILKASEEYNAKSQAAHKETHAL